MKDKPKTIYDAYTQGQLYMGDSVHEAAKATVCVDDLPTHKELEKEKIQKMNRVVEGLMEEDMINSPPHYKNGKIECIDAMEAMLSPEEFVGYLRGNVFKYLWRYQHKGKAHEDLQKAQWYLARLVFVHNPR